MNHFTTNLAKSIAEGGDIKEFIRQEIESALNQLLKHELTAFLDYEPYDPAGYNSGNSRNGYYSRQLKTTYGTLNINVPRDRMGEFVQQLIPSYKQTGNDLETTIMHLYKKGITTREVADLIERMYGHYYSPATISNITKLVDKDVKAFHNRPVKERYVVIYCDATFVSVRRDIVQKEAMHTIIGIDEQGHKEVLDYCLFPSESKENYRTLLQSLKSRGLKEVLIFVSDGLTGLQDALLEEFPKAKHQACWTHIARNVMNRVRARDKLEVGEDLRKIHQSGNFEQAQAMYEYFSKKWKPIYPKVITLLDRHDNLFTYLGFPKAIQRSLYTNNIIENFNKRVKKHTKVKEQFPNENAFDRCACTISMIYNERFGSRIHKGFAQVQAELSEMFEKTASP
jgi:transposase-like protein